MQEQEVDDGGELASTSYRVLKTLLRFGFCIKIDMRSEFLSRGGT